MTSFAVTLDPVIDLTDERFIQICQQNPELRYELDAKGNLIIMEGTGGESGIYNSEINTDTSLWNRQIKLGKVFDSSTMFRLPNGALRSPDLSWIRQDRWDQLTPEQKSKFPPLCPDFVVELRSPSDSIGDLQTKMKEYIDNGAHLGWLIDPLTRQVEIYRPNSMPQILLDPITLSGEDVLPGFVLNLKSVWQ